MHLNYLEIQGFKSFPDKTRITFETGYTGIVGPNGSGKSNISDAVLWVLGEQSSKSLRGGKMEDVIFGGTQLRKPMGFAQVSLCMDNSDKRIPDAGDKIVVSRRFYRSGDSEYLINGATVRLRDVRETFMDTGLGRDGYSIIGQGKISEIVSAKSTGRREIFEEASGIAKYRYRKNEAATRLASALDNISRLRDILDELESRVGPLKEQSEKAQKFLELSEQRKNLEITLYCDSIERAREKLREQDDKIAIARQDYDGLEAQVLGINEKLEEYYELNRSRNVDIERYNNEIVELSRRIGAIDSDIAVRRNDIEHCETQIAELQSTIDTLSSDNGVANSIAAREAEIAAKQQELSALDETVARAQSDLDALISSREAGESERASAAKRLTELQQEITELRVSSVGAQSASDTLENHAATIEAQLPVIKQRIELTEHERSENDKYLDELRADIADCDNRINGFKLKLDSRNARFSELSAELESKNAQINECTQRINVLRDLDRNMDGFAPSVKRVLTASEQREVRGIVGTVASLITVRKGCELAIETALGMAAQNIVVSDERSAKQAIAYLKDNRAGRATFLPLDTIKPSRFDDTRSLSDEGVVGLASTLVSCESRYESVVSSLLGRIIVADDLECASVAAKKLGYRYRFVTMDGQVINAGGSYTGGSSSRSAGLFSRKGEIEKLENRIKEIKNSCGGAQQQLEKIAAERAALQAEIDALNSDSITHNEDRVRAETENAQLMRTADELKETLNDMHAELASVASRKEENARTIAHNDERIAALSRDVHTLELASGQNGDTADDFMRVRTELSDALSQRKIERVEMFRDLQTLEYSLEQLREQLRDASGRSDELTASVARQREIIEEIQTKIQLREQEKSELEQGIAQRRESIDAAVAERAQNEQGIAQIQSTSGELIHKREDIAKEMSRLEERKVALQAEFDSFNAKLWDEYELTRSEAQPLCVAFESITELRSQVSSLRARIKALGNVNVGAIDEYKEVSERAAFMSEQLADVEKSREQLLELIASLEQEMRTMFTASFSEINNHFRRVFVELFGGGSASLSLSDETDVLESGIEIDVQPPGKVIKNLASLSGGEQSLVAIAIYMSILAVNPSPFCILDEIDSALDESNVSRFANYLGRVTSKTQIITITHRRGTMEAADVLYGVTMQEEGVSKVLKLDVEEAQLVISNK